MHVDLSTWLYIPLKCLLLAGVIKEYLAAVLLYIPLKCLLLAGQDRTNLVYHPIVITCLIPAISRWATIAQEDMVVIRHLIIPAIGRLAK